MNKVTAILFALVTLSVGFAHHPAGSARPFYINEQQGNYLLNVEAQETVGNTLIEIEVMNNLDLDNTSITLTATNIYNKSQQITSQMTRAENRFESDLDLSQSRWQIVADISGDAGQGQLEFIVEPVPARVNPPAPILLALAQVALVMLGFIMLFYKLQGIRLFEPIAA